MYLDNLKDVIGKQCVCCKQFIPFSGTDEYGHKIEFVQNHMDLCSECYNIAIEMIRECKESKNKTKY